MTGCAAGGGNDSGAEPAPASEDTLDLRPAAGLLTALPPRVGLSLKNIQDAQASLPYCRLSPGYVTPYVLQAYYSDQGFDGCVVAWIGDTGNSLEVNANYAEDVYRIYVKRSGPAVGDTVFRMLGDGVGPVDLHLGRPLKDAVDTFSLALTAQGYPIVAWLHQQSVHAPNVVLQAAQWDGQAWVNMGAELNDENSADSVASKPRLTWNANDQLVLSWDETVGSTTRRIQRVWNGNVWTE
ncbi:hypothetical protein [Stigmatella erecta]|uniref:Uncharacterized protein n=1 Tax=Stigmatella erecta TaxID=83460 RepID=A0A1I0L532_9BACT|nr:hypothetical protein [Stigmatella erecta]SEU34008.1 hypothetical protein SAMN05443639_11829 [Stigmatella erecta]